MRVVDTNVLLYAASKVADEQPKARVALEILDSQDLALSVQVLQGLQAGLQRFKTVHQGLDGPKFMERGLIPEGRPGEDLRIRQRRPPR